VQILFEIGRDRLGPVHDLLLGRVEAPIHPVRGLRESRRG
jgi:hypothetical protein